VLLCRVFCSSTLYSSSCKIVKGNRWLNQLVFVLLLYFVLVTLSIFGDILLLYKTFAQFPLHSRRVGNALPWLLLLQYNFGFNLYKHIQQIVHAFIQWHVEEGSVALYCI
jgi:hypothetical protein